jgi:hypothetical protein
MARPLCIEFPRALYHVTAWAEAQQTTCLSDVLCGVPRSDLCDKIQCGLFLSGTGGETRLPTAFAGEPCGTCVWNPDLDRPQPLAA